MYLRLLIFYFVTCQSFALDFVPGSGSKFSMLTQGQTVELNIYVAKRTKHALNIEMHFGAGGIIPINMWQQFEFELQGKDQPLKISKGYIKTMESKSPEIMVDEFFNQNKGVQVHDFLFSNKDEIAKYLIAKETVEVPAGSIKAHHYRKKNNGQTVDFWIAEQVGPISLVKLVSKSDKDDHGNYSIELKSLLVNVSATIDPSQAMPMGIETKKLMGKKIK